MHDDSESSDEGSDYSDHEDDQSAAEPQIDLLITTNQHTRHRATSGAASGTNAKQKRSAKPASSSLLNDVNAGSEDEDDGLYEGQYDEDEISDAEEANLESILFGSGFTEKLCAVSDGDDHSREDVSAGAGSGQPDDEPVAFVIDTVGGNKQKSSRNDTAQDDACSFPSSVLQSASSNSKRRKPAWQDTDDDKELINLQAINRSKKLRETADETVVGGTKFQEKLQAQFAKTVGAPSWAMLPEEKYQVNEEEDAILRTSGKILGESQWLPQGPLRIRKENRLFEDAESSVSIARFHPTATIALLAGRNKRLRLHKVDFEKNACIRTVFLEKFRIHQAEFSADGNQVIMSGNKSVFLVYDLLQGKVDKIPGIAGHPEVHLEQFDVSRDGRYILFQGSAGYVHLVYAKTHQWYHSFKINGSLKCAVFSADSKLVYAAGGDGEVYVFNVFSRACVHRFTDEGSIKSTCIACSPNGRWLAVGSSCGIVNIYDETHRKSKQPRPVKVVQNLTTAITGVRFNPTSEMLAVYSVVEKSAIKLVHLGSMTVFANWPVHRANKKQQLDYVNTVDFSPGGGYMAVGLSSGKALMFRLFHYKQF